MNPFLQASSLGFKTLFEFVYTSAGINEFLFAGKERMTFGTNFNSEIALCGFCIYNFSASASNSCIDIVRMDSFFHCLHLTFRIITVILIISRFFLFCNRFFDIFLNIFKIFFTLFEFTQSKPLRFILFLIPNGPTVIKNLLRIVRFSNFIFNFIPQTY